MASVKLARARILELCDRFGVETYLGALDLMLDRNKRAMSELIRTSVPDEELYFEDYVCDDSIGHGPYKYVWCNNWLKPDVTCVRPAELCLHLTLDRIACTMTKKPGGRLSFDFTGTDPQSPGSINFFLNADMFRMFTGVSEIFNDDGADDDAYYDDDVPKASTNVLMCSFQYEQAYMIMVFDPEIILNDGFYDLVDVNIPEGSLLKPRKPAALSCRTHALGRIFDILTGKAHTSIDKHGR